MIVRESGGNDLIQLSGGLIDSIEPALVGQQAIEELSLSEDVEPTEQQLDVLEEQVEGWIASRR